MQSCAFSIYGSKVRAYYRSTQFTNLNLEITLERPGQDLGEYIWHHIETEGKNPKK